MLSLSLQINTKGATLRLPLLAALCKESAISPVTHFMLSWLSSNSINIGLRERSLITFAGISPDIDGLGLLIDLATTHSTNPTNYWGEYHHGLHTLSFSLIVGVTALLLSSKHKIKVCALALAMFHVHLLCDIIGARGPDGYQWPIPYLMPFSEWPELVWAGQWELNAWPNIVFTALLAASIFLIARYKHRTPFEVVSSKMNIACLNILRCK